MLTRLLCCLALLVSLGCTSSTEPTRDADTDEGLTRTAGVDFRTDRSEYRQGEVAGLVLQNSSDQPIGYNLCVSAAERRAGGGWERIEPLRVCATVLYTLAPSAEVNGNEPITGELPPGEYRIVTTVELMRAGTRTEVFTPTFTIVP